MTSIKKEYWKTKEYKKEWYNNWMEKIKKIRGGYTNKYLFYPPYPNKPDTGEGQKFMRANEKPPL
jgi:hypothetical protein